MFAFGLQFKARKVAVFINQRTVSLLVTICMTGFLPVSSFAQVPQRHLKGDRLVPSSNPARADTAAPVSNATPSVQSPKFTEPSPKQLRGDCPGMASEVCAVFSATNRERAQNGLAVFKYDPACQKAADDHARDMAGRGFFSHTSPDGGTLTSRYERYGRWSNLAENIAMGSHMDSQGAVQSWMNSPGHRKNILSPALGSMGVGIAQGRGFRYFVQCFSR